MSRARGGEYWRISLRLSARQHALGVQRRNGRRFQSANRARRKRPGDARMAQYKRRGESAGGNQTLGRTGGDQQSLQSSGKARFLRRGMQKTRTRSGKDDDIRVARNRCQSEPRAAGCVRAGKHKVDRLLLKTMANGSPKALDDAHGRYNAENLAPKAHFLPTR